MKVVINRKLIGTNRGVYVGTHSAPPGMLFEYMPNYSTGDYDVVFNQQDTTYGISQGINYSDESEYIYPEMEPTILIKKEDGNLFEFDSANKNSYTISFWVKVNRFPAGIYYETGGTVRRKRTKLLSLKYGTDNTGYQDFGNSYYSLIDFGALAPYYKYDNDIPYKFVYEPISFTCTFVYPMNGYQNIDDTGKRMDFSIYTDYSYNLETWYFITISISPSTGNFDTSGGEYIVKMFVDNQQVNVAYHKSNVVSNTGNRNSSLVISTTSRRNAGEVAAGPYFINRYGDTITNVLNLNYNFYNFLLLDNLNCISFSPIKYRMLLYKNGIRYKRLYQNTGIDFGKLYIYEGITSDAYNELKDFYKS